MVLSAIALSICLRVPLLQEIQWQHDADLAFKAAAADKKIVVMDFETEWCGFCKKMDATTFKNPQAVEQAKQFVFLKLDAEKEGKSLAEQYKIEAFPTMVFVDPELGVVGRSRGYKNAKEWTDTADSVLKACADYRSLGGISPGDRTVQDKMKLAKIYAVWSRPDEAIKEFDFASNLVSNTNEIGNAALSIGDALVALGRDNEALNYFSIASTNLNEISLRARAMDSAIYAADRAGKKDEAKEWARKLYTWKDCPKPLKMSAEAAYHRLGG